MESFDRRLLAPMIIGAILNPINSSIIAVALAPIGAAFGAPASQTAWLVSALYLATSVGQPLVGRLVDSFGPRRLFLIGAVFTFVAGILGTLAPNLWVLVAARVILGFGTCAGYPAAMYLIRSESERTGLRSPAGVLTALTVSSQTVSVIGPTLGGLLIDVGGWRATLAINLPLGLLSFVLGYRHLPRTATGARPRIDYPGILLFVASLVSLLVYLMEARSSLLWLLAITVLAGVAFVWWECRREDPLIDVRVLAGNAPLVATYARGFAASTVSYAFMYGFTQWMEEGRGLSASVAGLVLLPTFGTGLVVSSLTGRRPEIKGKITVGAITQVLVCVLVLLVHPHTAVWLLVVIALLAGIPQGLVNLGNQNALYYQADPARMGSSAGLLRTFMYLGAIAASTGNGVFFGVRATTPGMHHLGIFMLAVAVAFLAITLTDRSLGRVGTSEAAVVEEAAGVSG
jgi:MFS family permease